MNERTREVHVTEAQAARIAKVNLPDSLLEVVGNPPRRSFRLTSSQADALVSILGDQLQRGGFDAKYKPTTDGSMVESIIDALRAARE